MQPTKATLKNLDTGEVIRCQFNPTEYTIQKSNTWQPKPVVGKNVPKLEFGGGGARVLNIELLLDSFENQGQDVRGDVEKLWKLTMITEAAKNTTTNRSRPPLVLLQWGGTWSFKAVVTSLNVRYTLFREDGSPVRAMASLSLQEAEDVSDQPGTNPTSYSEPGYKRRLVRPRDSLALIAYEEYGDATLWRHLAKANNLDDPTDLKPGDLLAIPPLVHR